MTSTWTPWGAERKDGVPAPGALIAMDRAVWQATFVRAMPPDERDVLDEQRFEVTLEAMAGAMGERRVRTSCYGSWWTYPGRFPVCSCCGEPPPCRRQTAEDAAAAALEAMRRYERPGVCPTCGNAVSRRQRTVTFPENVIVPLGPPVTFHVTSARCRAGALAYERRWLEHHPWRESLVTSQPNGR